MIKKELTKDAQYLLCVMYKNYIEKHKNGIDKSEANEFGSSEDIHKNLISQWSPKDVDETCRELSRAGYINSTYADGISYRVILSDKALTYMENRFSNNVKEIFDYVIKIGIPFVPF